MLYIRELFKQDLRDGKQIAFPKEPSLRFFEFDYPNNPQDRQITFTIISSDENYADFDGKKIETRLYAAGSESRIDGQLKAFLRDELNAQIGDLIVFSRKDRDNTNIEVKFIPATSADYKAIHSLLGGNNHTIAFKDNEENKATDIEYKPKQPLQIIFYGAPGTGKSHQTDKLVEGDKLNKTHQRTTFHPDSDYSSFVGCYKPSKDNGELTYKFVPQAFLKAYVAAWKNIGEPYYLIIEEINRGNCAQIFGDIFQLLDRREDGFSKYHITSDTDIEVYLRDEAFAGVSADALPTIEDINTEQIISGKIMQLPSNLHIYATMNTSDQSLFPIDSAFKRRWEWEYKPIEQPQDALFRDWKIVTDDGAAYDWWKFLTEVNDRIFNTTQSEDKKMGYWFIKADAQRRITQKKFIGKVLFYLWNDIFKDYARTESTVFKVFKDAEKKESEEYTFTDFFRSEGVTDRIHRLMLTLGIKREEWVETNTENSESSNEKESSLSRLNFIVGTKTVSLRKAFYEITRQLLAKFPTTSFSTLVDTAKECGFAQRQFDSLFLKENDEQSWRNSHVNDTKIEQRYYFKEPLTSGDGVKFYVSGQGWINNPDFINPIMKYAEKFDIQISKNEVAD